MKRSYKDYIMDMIEAIEKIENFSQGMRFEDFERDDKTSFAVIRALEIIGEAAAKIPAVVQERYNQIPWKIIASMRHKLIHEYFGVNLKVVWETITKDIPKVKPLLKSIIVEM